MWILRKLDDRYVESEGDLKTKDISKCNGVWNIVFENKVQCHDEIFWDNFIRYH